MAVQLSIYTDIKLIYHSPSNHNVQDKLDTQNFNHIADDYVLFYLKPFCTTALFSIPYKQHLPKVKDEHVPTVERRPTHVNFLYPYTVLPLDLEQSLFECVIYVVETRRYATIFVTEREMYLGHTIVQVGHIEGKIKYNRKGRNTNQGQ